MGSYSEYPEAYPFTFNNTKGQPADRPGYVNGVPYDLRQKIAAVLAEVETSLQHGMIKHAAMHSPHEGHSVIEEEFEELWDHVKADTGRTPEARKEALQLAAMAVRYIIDLIDTPKED